MIQNDLSFHFDHPQFAFGDLQFSFQIFTNENVYGIDPERTAVYEPQEELRINCRGFTWAGGQERCDGQSEVMIKKIGKEITVEIHASHGSQIKVVKILINGLPEGSITHLGQITTDPKEGAGIEIPRGGDYLVSFPGWLPDGLIFLHAAKECIAFKSMDLENRPKRIYFTNRRGKFQVELIFEEDATMWSTTLDMPAWTIERDTTTSSAIDKFVTWLEALDDLDSWQDRSDVPLWLRDVKLVVNLHGEHWTGYVFNTFDEMLQILKTLHNWIPAKHILAYLPGFSGRYYEKYPEYQPGIRLGGGAGFQRLIEGSKEIGCHVMPMVGAHGCNLARFPRWRKAVVRDRYDQAINRLNLPDWDGDRCGDENQVFLNLGNDEYRDFLCTSISAMIERFQLDAIFLDTMSWQPNDARYSMWRGVQALMNTLRGRFPDVLWVSEGAHVRLIKYFPLVQVKLLPAERLLYPEFAYRYIRTFDHLDTGAPGLGSSGVHERGFHGFHLPEFHPNHIPALSIVKDTLKNHKDTVQEICQLAYRSEIGI